jgi:hypothetical protein
MERTIHVTPGKVRLENEGFLHFLARGGRVALRWIIGISLVATLVVMVSPMLFLAPIPALVLVVSYVLYILTRPVEERSDRAAEAIIAHHDVAGEAEKIEDAADMHRFAPDTVRIMKREGVHGMAILAAVMVIAVLFAAFFLPWEVVAIGAFVVTAYMILVATPVWLGWIEHDIEVQEGARETTPGTMDVQKA